MTYGECTRFITRRPSHVVKHVVTSHVAVEKFHRRLYLRRAIETFTAIDGAADSLALAGGRALLAVVKISSNATATLLTPISWAPLC